MPITPINGHGCPEAIVREAQSPRSHEVRGDGRGYGSVLKKSEHPSLFRDVEYVVLKGEP